jgi:hypothetical protein
MSNGSQGELLMAPGADINQCADPLRKNGIYLEGAANFVPAFGKLTSKGCSWKAKSVIDAE